MATTTTKREPLPRLVYTALRLTPDAIKIMDLIMRKRGVKRTAVVEWALRDLAEREKVQV